MTDDLQTLWQTAGDPAPQVGPETLASLRTEADRFDRQIRWRDRREYAAALLVAVLFGWDYPGAPPLVRVGIVLAVLGAAFVCVWMWRAQRRRPPAAPGAPTAEALRVALARVEIQIRLLRTVGWWYLLPLVPGPLWIAGVGLAEAVTGLPPIETTRNLVGAGVALLLALVVLAAVAGFFVFVYRLNQRAVDNDLVPLRDRLSSILRDLDHA